MIYDMQAGASSVPHGLIPHLLWNMFTSYSVGNPVEIEQKNRSSLLEKAINVYCIVYYSDKKFKS